MARKQGGVNKFLNFIGLVDAEPQTAVDDYADNYGRPSTYVPKQQRSRTEDTRRRTIVKDERGRSSSERYGSTRVTPPASRRSQASSYDYSYTSRSSSLAMFIYWIMTFLRFNNRFVEILAKFIYPFVRPFRRPAMWVMRRTGLPIDFTLWFAMIGINIVSELLYVLYFRLCLPIGLY